MKKRINHYSFVYIICSIFIFYGCGGLKKTLNAIPEYPENITTELKYSISEITEKAGEGLLNGLSKESSKENIKEAVLALFDTFNEELEKLDVDKIDVAVVGDNLVIGLVSSLERESDNIGDILNSTLDNVTLDGLFENLSSQENKEALASLFGYIFSAESENGKNLGDMLNRAIANIDLSPLGEQINQNINLNDALSGPTEAIVKASEALTAVALRWEDQQSNASRNLIYGLIAIIIIIFFFFYFKNLFDQSEFAKSRKINSILKKSKTLSKEELKELIENLTK